MARVELTEQGTAERFMEGHGETSCFLPAFGVWRQFDEKTGGWAEVGNGDIRRLVSRSIRAHGRAEDWGKGDMGERGYWLSSLSWAGQCAVLDLVRTSPSFCLEPGQFDRQAWGVLVPGGRISADDLHAEKEKPSIEHVFQGDLMHRCMAAQDPWGFRDGAVPEYCITEVSRDWEGILRFLSSALLQERGGPQLMVRGPIDGGRMDGLYALMRSLWGSYVEKLPAKFWLSPLTLPAGWVRRIQGCRLLFLEECRQNWPGQAAALATWLMDREVTYLGHDGVLRSLQLPTHLILCGTGTRPTSIDPVMAELVWFVPPITARAGRRPL